MSKLRELIAAATNSDVKVQGPDRGMTPFLRITDVHAAFPDANSQQLAYWQTLLAEDDYPTQAADYELVAYLWNNRHRIAEAMEKHFGA